MQAVLRHAGVRVASAQEFVAPGRTVAANHIDFTTGIVERRGQVVDKVEEARIEMADISSTVVAQKMVEVVKRFGDVLITATIDDIQPLARVSVIEAEPILVWGWHRRFCGMPRHRQRQKKNQREAELATKSPRGRRKCPTSFQEVHITRVEGAHPD